MPKQGSRTPLRDFKRTKIIATLGPASAEPEIIEQIIAAGANGLRLNFSHGSHSSHAALIRAVRGVSQARGKPVAIIQDLQGPKIRLGTFAEPMPLKTGQLLKLAKPGAVKADFDVPTQVDLSRAVKPGERLLFHDGRIRAQVTQVKGKVVTARIESGLILHPRKGINLPDTDLKGRILTKKDFRDIDFAVENDIDYIALSFVQKAADIARLRRYLAKQSSDIKVIAKIETKAAVDNLEEIVLVSDGVMVARGDLAIEVSPEAVPIVQRQIVGLAIKYGKLAIVATEMLASMLEEPSPTRAEVSDVATAVIVGADAVMLSDETAVGKYPVDAVQVMKRIIRYTESNSPVKPLFMNVEDESVQSAISSALITLAHQVGAQLILAETHSGATALSVAAHRPTMPVLMVTDQPRVAQQLAIVYGGKAFYLERANRAGEKVIEKLKRAKLLKSGDIIVRASGKHPGVSGGTDTIKVRKIK